MSDELELRHEVISAELRAVRRELAAETFDPNAGKLAEVEHELATLRTRLKELELEVRWRELRNERARPREP